MNRPTLLLLFIGLACVWLIETVFMTLFLQEKQENYKSTHHGIALFSRDSSRRNSDTSLTNANTKANVPSLTQQLLMPPKTRFVLRNSTARFSQDGMLAKSRMHSATEKINQLTDNQRYKVDFGMDKSNSSQQSKPQWMERAQKEAKYCVSLYASYEGHTLMCKIHLCNASTANDINYNNRVDATIAALNSTDEKSQSDHHYYNDSIITNDGDNNDHKLRYSHGLYLRTWDKDVHQFRMSISGEARAGSGCALSLKYNFMYIHTLKSGGMTIKAFLKRALCNNSTVMPCQSGNDVLEIVDCRRALKKYPHVLVWSVVRNPYHRLYSGYAMAYTFAYDYAKKGKVRYFRGKKISELFKSDNNNNAGFDFARFVHANRQESVLLSPTSTAHYEPQSSFLFSNVYPTCPVFDYLVRMEHLEQDLEGLWALLGNPPEIMDYIYQQNKNVDHENSNISIGHEETTAFGSKGELNMTTKQDAYKDDDTRQAAYQRLRADFENFDYDANNFS